MSRRVVTKEDVLAAKGGVLEVGPEDVVTAAAAEAATRAAIKIVERAAGTARSASTPAAAAVAALAAEAQPLAGSPAWDSFAPGSSSLSNMDGRTAAIVTAVGRNRPFVLAEITTKIGELNGDIFDISQRIVSGYFSTIFVVDIGRISTDFAGFKGAVEALSKEGDYKIVVQHERIFRAMHRI